jgi:PilZ domain.
MTQHAKTQDKLQRQSGVRLALEAGMRMFLTLDSMRDNDDNRISCEVVGVAHFEFLILRLPWIPGLKQRLIPGTWGTLRFVSKGELYGFHVEVLNHAVKPALLLFLAYPEVVETLSLRQHKRVACALPAHVHSRRGDGFGIVQDLSQGGCRLSLDVRGQAGLRQLIVGDELLLRTSVAAEGMPGTTTSTVRSIALDTSRVVLGLSFSAADAEFQKALAAYIDLSELLA